MGFLQIFLGDKVRFLYKASTCAFSLRSGILRLPFLNVDVCFTRPPSVAASYRHVAMLKPRVHAEHHVGSDTVISPRFQWIGFGEAGAGDGASLTKMQ